MCINGHEADSGLWDGREVYKIYRAGGKCRPLISSGVESYKFSGVISFQIDSKTIYPSVYK